MIAITRPPGIAYRTFRTRSLDPANPDVAVKYQNVTNLVPVRGSSPQPWPLLFQNMSR